MDYTKLLNDLLLPFIAVLWSLTCAGVGIGFLFHLLVYKYKQECEKEMLKYKQDISKPNKTDVLYNKVDYLVSCANKHQMYLDRFNKDE